MSRISKDIRVNVKAGAQIPAVVIDVTAGLATVRLGGNGALMRRLNVVGGPVVAGDVVKVDFTTSIPYVLATSTRSLTSSDISHMLLGVSGGGGGGIGAMQITITLFSGGSVKAMYPSTDTGLTDALAASNIGDVVFLPDVDITGDFSVPIGVNLVGLSSRESILRGNLSFEPGCLLENLRVQNQNGADATAVTATLSAETTFNPTHKIKGCELYGYCCGANIAIGVRVDSADIVMVIENSTIVGDSNSGDGYAFSSTPGADVRIYHSAYYGSTAHFYEA